MAHRVSKRGHTHRYDTDVEYRGACTLADPPVPRVLVIPDEAYDPSVLCSTQAAERNAAEAKRSAAEAKCKAAPSQQAKGASRSSGYSKGKPCGKGWKQ